MRTRLHEVTFHYSEIISGYATALGAVKEQSGESAVYARHLLLQIEHFTKNALLELKHLPPRKD